MNKRFRATLVWLSLSSVLILGGTVPVAHAENTAPEPFGLDFGVTDALNDVYAWFEEDATYRWGEAPAWASYCDIRAVNVSYDTNTDNYSIWVTFTDNVNTSRIQTGYAGVRVFVNMTQVPLSLKNATLELVYGGNLASAGEVTNHLSYAQVRNATHSFNIRDIAVITGKIVNFSFPNTLSDNITEFSGIMKSIDQWSVVVWAWDFFTSTAGSEGGDLFFDEYGDPTFREQWGAGSFVFPVINGYNVAMVAAAMAFGIIIIRKKAGSLRGRN